MSAPVNFFDGVGCAMGSWIALFAGCAFEQAAAINETVMMASTNAVFRIMPLVSFLKLIHASKSVISTGNDGAIVEVTY